MHFDNTNVLGIDLFSSNNNYLFVLFCLINGEALAKANGVIDCTVIYASFDDSLDSESADTIKTSSLKFELMH